jgi:hypothetical protein
LTAAAPRWFTLRYGAFSKHLLKLLASGPERSGIALNEKDIAIEMGRSFAGRAPRGSIDSARTLTDTVLSRGVHGWSGDWLVNGAGDGLVELRFEPPMRGHVLGFPVHVRRLRIAVDDPDGLVEALAGAPSG